MTWAPEGKRKKGRPKETWRRTVERERDKRWDGQTGMKYNVRPKTEKTGGNCVPPYASQGVKRISKYFYSALSPSKDRL